jgi:hypothetical protein
MSGGAPEISNFYSFYAINPDNVCGMPRANRACNKFSDMGPGSINIRAFLPLNTSKG